MLKESVDMVLGLLMNLTFLISLTILSDFVDSRVPRNRRAGVILQGILFGTATLIGMLRPLVVGPGLIFDGRSIMLSLCAWYFGPLSVTIAAVMPLILRVSIGGSGMIMGVLAILSSSGIGLIARKFLKPEQGPPATSQLYVFGIAVHTVMIGWMLTLPAGVGLSTFQQVGPWIMTLYPLATILAGKILSDQVTARLAVSSLRESEQRFKLSMEAAGAGLWDLDVASDIAYYDSTYFSILGYDAGEYEGTGYAWRSRLHPDDVERTLAENQKCIDGLTDYIDVEYRMHAKDGSIRWIKARGKCITRDDHGKATRIVGTHLDITDRRQTDERLRHSLEEKEVLLREMHHRVKNNLNVITSLLNLQSSTIKTPEQAMDAFHNSRDRIMAMALVHEELYKSPDYVNVDMEEYLKELLENLKQGYGSGDRIEVQMHVTAVTLNVTASIPCGLIISELVSNAFKYAFPQGKSGTISVVMDRSDDGVVSLAVADNGVGLSRPFVDLSNNDSGSLGLTLVKLLTEQLGGTLDVSVRNGTSYCLAFPGTIN